MEKKEEVLKWIGELFMNSQNQNYTGKIKVEADFSQGGITHCEVAFGGRFAEIRKNI